MTQLNDTVSLITGGGTGIGLAIAEAFLAQGASVVVTGRREAPLKALAERYPERAAYVQADVTKPGDARRAVEFTAERFGRLDVLVNNAGVFVGKPLVETTEDEISSMLAVNVAGLIAFSREAVPFLAKTKGSILNVSSVAGKGVFPGASVYSATKAAVNHLTRSFASELGAEGIRVNAVSPGLTVTDMSVGIREQQEAVEGTLAQTPLGRLGQPEDIARVAAFLVGPDAGWVTGEIVAASGGLLV